MRKFLLLGLGAFAFFSSACNDDVSLATSDVVVDSSSSVVPVPVEESSSSESSNSDAPNPVTESSSAESSSSAERSSSSVKSSSSGKNVYSRFLWDGTTDFVGRVETGSPDKTSGYWFNYSDVDEGGTSRFIFPPDVEPDTYDNFFGPLIEAYAGIKASVTLGDGYDYPYVGLGFNVWSETQEGVDVSEWGGICLSYQSTIPFVIELGVEDEGTVMEYGNYRASVPKAQYVTVIDIPWKKFSIDEALKKVAAIKLQFEGEAGTTGNFLIQKVGSVGECSRYYPLALRAL